MGKCKKAELAVVVSNTESGQENPNFIPIKISDMKLDQVKLGSQRLLVSNIVFYSLLEKDLSFII
ncbi:hypothetical protein N0B40_02290 [Chryseobacterium oranimense]|uniref:hypothetical protein n=1 Tax=Chryseobacterium oranimense TaxID=421058 RepID=UPI0021AFDF48|nr:hypothetical protein [Chryseobacterium oranimense]UWX61111.1 hypothetical protein N0B40_02290 [Chryseobacterium oranimense]